MVKMDWNKPQIQVLTRPGSEEPVLLACKIGAAPSPSGPVYQDLACYQSAAPCARCSGLVSS